MPMDLPRPGKTNHSRQFKCPRGPRRCLRLYVLVLDPLKPMGQKFGPMDIHLRLIPDRPRLCSPLDHPPLQFTSQTMPTRSKIRGNILTQPLVVDTTHRIHLPIPATLLQDFRIRHRGSQHSGITLTFPIPRRQVTQDLAFSLHPRSWSVLRNQIRHPGIRL